MKTKVIIMGIVILLLLIPVTNSLACKREFHAISFDKPTFLDRFTEFGHIKSKSTQTIFLYILYFICFVLGAITSAIIIYLKYG